jgi:hypothetical protein
VSSGFGVVDEGGDGGNDNGIGYDQVLRSTSTAAHCVCEKYADYSSGTPLQSWIMISAIHKGIPFLVLLTRGG